MKIFLIIMLILATLFLFAESGPQNPGTLKQRNHNTITTPRDGGNVMFASNEEPTASSLSIKKSATAENADVALPQKSQHTKLSVYPNAKDGEILVQAEKDADISELYIQIYNNTGERVYYSKLETHLQKVNMSNYLSGKYLIEVGGQTYRMMVIQ